MSKTWFKKKITSSQNFGGKEMTTSIKVKSANYPALVEYTDRWVDTEGNERVSEGIPVVLWPEDGEVYFYCTTTRQVRVTDLEYDDPRAVKAKEAKNLS